jgi:hypothetical protein
VQGLTARTGSGVARPINDTASVINVRLSLGDLETVTGYSADGSFLDVKSTPPLSYCRYLQVPAWYLRVPGCSGTRMQCRQGDSDGMHAGRLHASTTNASVLHTFDCL